MGMFDYIRCYLPLPDAPPLGLEFQTKDTDDQFLIWYEIRGDGTLWKEVCDFEDHSDPAAKGVEKLIGMLTRTNSRWIWVMYEGDLEFYTSNITASGPQGTVTSDGGPAYSWCYTAKFLRGKVIEITGGATLLDRKIVTREEWWQS